MNLEIKATLQKIHSQFWREQTISKTVVTEEDIRHNRDRLKIFDKSVFMSETIHREIQNSVDRLFHFKSQNITINFFCVRGHSVYQKYFEELNYSLERAFAFLKTANSGVALHGTTTAETKDKRTDYEEITIYLFLSEQKKTFAWFGSPWRADNVNSGFSFRGNPHSIVVYRKEEVFKVCVHEMLHALGLDIYDDSDLFPVDSFALQSSIPVYINEAYVETWATLINCVFCAQIQENFYENILVERNFLLSQVGYILKRGGFKSWSEFHKGSEEEQQHQQQQHHNIETFDKNLKQETSMFSYFILRCALFYDVQWLLQNFLVHDKKDLTVLRKQGLAVFRSEAFIKDINKRLRDDNDAAMLKNRIRMTFLERSGVS